ncbi:hypothetical protein LINGRAHAP2_LOCUS18353 [Linum grandiflorum]
MATFPFPHHNHHHLLLLPSYNKLSASHLPKTTKPISMGAKTAAAGGLCLNRIRPHVRSVRSPQEPDQAIDNHDGGGKKTATGAEAAVGGGRKVMIVVDSSAEAKVALQWALSHTVQTHDSLLLLHVAKPSTNHHHQGLMKGRGSRGYELVSSLKKMSQMKRPEVEIEALIVEGKEKGPAILEEAKKQEVALLVLGQRKRSSMTWRLIMMWASNKLANAAGAGAGGVVEYCIQNAECMAIAVRRKSKKHGGYLITTKRHKDFWLLA